MSRFARSAALAAAAALVAVPAASPGSPATDAAQDGAVSRDGAVRYVAEAAAPGATRLLALDARGGAVRIARVFDGRFAVPALGPTLGGLGLFRDGARLVLQSVDRQDTTTFQIVRTADLSTDRTITLQGAFSFDALSPDGQKLYLIQHQSASDLRRYVVRLYDLATGTLVDGRVADTRQKSWIMSGYAAARTESRDGRWVYTLYANPENFPFVHALDTVTGTARCVGIAWRGDQTPLTRYTLAVQGRRLLVRRGDGRVYRTIDRATYTVRAP